MIDPAEFLLYLRDRGLTVRHLDGKLLVSPKDAILAPDAECIRENKAGLIEALTWEAQEAADNLDNSEIAAAVAVIEGRIGKRDTGANVPRGI